jgi:hypothetical protein
MKTIGEAIKEYKLQHPNATSLELDAFLYGWTAHEVATQLKNGEI